jgi:hypothetical protein
VRFGKGISQLLARFSMQVRTSTLLIKMTTGEIRRFMLPHTQTMQQLPNS